ncbi:Uncharacterised protein [Moraxella bovis]|uniref:Uncharacterized protein n=1 Tax=Moraxella bovis TaxID=476 RepID=A0A378PU67_MORBO|nr:Uncharacterised protein [Moraxella bovis]
MQIFMLFYAGIFAILHELSYRIVLTHTGVVRKRVDDVGC